MNITVQYALRKIPLLLLQKRDTFSPGNQIQDAIQAWHQAQTQHLRMWFISLFTRGLCAVISTLSVCLPPLDLKTNGLKGYLQTSQPIFSGRTRTE